MSALKRFSVFGWPLFLTLISSTVMTVLFSNTKLQYSRSSPAESLLVFFLSLFLPLLLFTVMKFLINRKTMSIEDAADWYVKWLGFVSIGFVASALVARIGS